MGLAVVYGIVESHGGIISVDSQIGKGATFHVFFPRVEREDAPLTEVSEHLLVGNERILFVDDEQAMVHVGKQMLESLGYEVVAKSNSTEALEAFRAEPNEFDLVITDQIMPQMTGEMLAKELIRIRPDIPIILCAGRSDQIQEEGAEAIGIRRFVMKPMVARVMAEAIREVLHL
jgi:two-component system cell cycle sensor histidine kinase/response regulator CckA